LYLRTPANRAMVKEKMSQTREIIEGKLLAKGPSVVRHLSLPKRGRSTEDIEEELENLRIDLKPTNYREGKLSGAVYRKVLFSLF